MRDTFADSVFLVGMPRDMRRAAEECLEVRNGVEIAGCESFMPRSDANMGRTRSIVCFAESPEQFRIQARLISRRIADVIGCVKGGGVTAEETGAYAVIAIPDRQSARQIEEMFTRIVYLVRSARLKSSIMSADGREGVGCAAAGIKVIAIGASAGGTRAIERIVSCFERDFPCVLVVQHMAKGFTDLFINTLKSRCQMSVCAAEDSRPISEGRVYVAPWGSHMRLINDAGLRISLEDGESVSGHKPSVDALFSSVAKAAGKNAIGAILTGMGRDGAAGLLEMRNAGAATIGQDKDSSTVYGMPMEAFNIGAVQRQLPLEMIANEIRNIVLARRAV